MDADAGPRRKAHRGKRGNKKRGARKLQVESLTPGQLREAESLLARQLDAAASARLPTKGLKDGRGRIREEAGLLRPPAPVYKDSLVRAETSGGSDGEEDDDLFDLGADRGVLALISSASDGSSRGASGAGGLAGGPITDYGVRFASGYESSASSAASALTPSELLSRTPLEGLCALPNARALLLEAVPPAMLVDLLLRASAKLRDAAAASSHAASAASGSSSAAAGGFGSAVDAAVRRSRSRSRGGGAALSSAADADASSGAGSLLSSGAALDPIVGSEAAGGGGAAPRGSMASRSASLGRRSASVSASMPRRSPTPRPDTAAAGASAGDAGVDSLAEASGADAAGPRAAKRRRPDGPP